MSRFGISEVIRPISMNKIVADKDSYMFGEVKASVEKEAESYQPTDEQFVLSEVIKAIRRIYSGASDYGCIELFTDVTRKRSGVTHMNVCHMKRTK